MSILIYNKNIRFLKKGSCVLIHNTEQTIIPW